MRQLTIKDAFAFSRIIDKMGIDVDLNELLDKGSEKGQEWMGGQMALLIIKKLHKAEGEVMEFLSSLENCTIEEMGNKPVVYIKELISGLTKDPQFADFFKSAGNEQK